MSKAIFKITVRCPHCHAQQQEPAMAKSTFCRRCSEYFAISDSNRADADSIPPAVAPAKASGTWERASSPVPVDARKQFPVSPPPADTTEGLRGKIEGLFASKPKTQVAHCFECTSWHEVSSSAQSTTCKSCGAYIDLQDYKVTGSFSRNIKTRGTVHLSAKGDLSSSKIICSHATIHGRMRGNLVCLGRVIIRVQGKLFGSVEAGELIVEKGSDVAFARPIHAATAEVYGRMSGQIIANGHVTIYKHGLLDGSVAATGFSVEKGGCFQGELTISPPPRASDSPTVEPKEKAPAQDAMHSGLLASGEQSPALG